MSNEMISVPRATLQKWLDDIGPSRHVTQYASLKRDELRALLGKPAAQNQGEPVCRGCGDSGVIDDKDKDELPSGHYVEKGLGSCPECEEQPALLAKPDPNTDVRTILLDVVPGDGDGREVYATCCDDIVTMLSDQADRIEELEAAQPQGEHPA